MYKFIPALVLAPLLASCAYVTAKPAPLGSNVAGIPFYGVRNYVLIRGNEVVSLAMPDCTQRYALQIGSVLAKNHTVVDFSSGVITKLDTDQDSSDAIKPLFDFAKSLINPASAAGKAMSNEAAGTQGTQFGLFVAHCEGTTLTLEPAIQDVRLQTFTPLPPQPVKAQAAPDTPARPSTNPADGDPIPQSHR